MAANNCEFCGKAFGSTNPRTFVLNHAVCKSCRAKIEATGAKDFETVKELVEQSELEAKKREEQEELELKMLEEQLERKREELKAKRLVVAAEVASYKGSEIVFSVDGARGKHIDIYPDKCVITTTVTLGSVISGNATDGEKTIYYKDVIGFQYKKSGLTLGYMQFETASKQMNNGDSNFSGENSFVYEGLDTETTEFIDEVVAYVKYRLDFIKNS